MTGVDASEGEDEGSFVNGPSVPCVDGSHVHNYCTVHDLVVLDLIHDLVVHDLVVPDLVVHGLVVLDLSYPAVPTTSSASRWMLVTMAEKDPQVGAVVSVDAEGKGYHVQLAGIDRDQDGAAVHHGTDHLD